MFTSKSIFALVVVIFASTHLCLNRSSAAESPLLGGEEVPNASILAASKLPVLHHPQTEQQQQLNSEKSDHNFYLPTPEKANLSLEEAKAVLPLSRRKRSTSALKRPPVCLHLFTSLISPPNHHKQCSVIQKAKKTPNTAQSLSSSPAASVARPPPTATSKVPKYNATPEDCDLPKDTSLLKEGAGNDPEIIHPPQSQQDKKQNISSQSEDEDSSTTTTTTTTTTIKTTTTRTVNNNNNKSIQSTVQQSESTVDDIIRMKAPPVSAKDMLSFEEWRKKISEQMEHSEQKKQRDLNLISQQESQGSLADLGGAGGSVQSASKATNPSLNGINNGKPTTITNSQTLPTNRARNFASHECGAKIVDSNAEADFVNRLLNEQTDEYMLNPCKTANWFVIELCETIQPAYLEMANFELYSSIPKDFSVAASEHYPARGEWSSLGAFTAADVRTVQGFKLANNGFVKYLRVQLHSYYGAEHFCPVSVMRVFGTSLFDEVERIDKPETLAIVDSSADNGGNLKIVKKDEEEGGSVAEEPMSTIPATPVSPLTAQTTTSAPSTTTGQPNIFGSAKNAVYSIVMRALNLNVFNRILDNFSSVNGTLSGREGQLSGAGSADEAEQAEAQRRNTFNVHDQSVVMGVYDRYEHYLDACETFFSGSNSGSSLFNHSHSTLNIPRKCIYLRFLLFPDDRRPLFDLLYTQYVIRRYINSGLLFQCALNRTYAQLNATGLSLLIANAKLQQLNRGKNFKVASLPVNLSVDGQQLVILEDGGHQQKTITSSSSLADQINHSSSSLLATSVSGDVTSSSSIFIVPEGGSSSTTDELKYNFTASTAVPLSSIESSIIAPTVVQPLVSTSQLPSLATITAADSSVTDGETIVLVPLDNSSRSGSEGSNFESEKSPSSSSEQKVLENSVSADSTLPPPQSQTPLPQIPTIESYQTGEATSPSGEVLSSSSGQSKEAVIIRLTNRIKHLEKNISLMSTYLESLSVRYRNQMEEMQLIFNKTIDHLNNTAIRAAEKDAKQQENIMTLESEINQLKVAIEEVKGNSSFDLSSWLAANRDHLLLMGAELFLVVVLLSCFFSSNSSNNRRRSSLSGLGISPAELVLLNAQTGVNVKKSLHHRSKSLSDLQAADNQQPPSSDRSSSRAEEVVEEGKDVLQESSSTLTEDDKTSLEVCNSVDANCDTSNCPEDSSSSSSSSNKENLNCKSPATPLANGGSSGSFFLGNGILRPSNGKKGILNESNNIEQS